MNAPLELNERELLALAERVEAASGPDREIDCLIFEPRTPGFTPEMRGTFYGSPTGRYFDIACNPPEEMAAEAPMFTASFDAVLSLLSEGSEIDLTNLYGVARAHVDMNNEYGGHHGEHLGVSLILATLSACLRAIAAKGEGR